MKKKKAGKRRAAKRGAKRVASKPAKRGARRKPAARRRAKPAARRPARRAKPAAKKRAKAKAPGKPKSAKRPAPKATAKPAAKRAKLALVARPARKPRPAPAPEPFAEAKAGASARDLALFELVRARVAVHAAIQGMTPPSADQPTGAGKWTFREMILHLAYWDGEMHPALEDMYLHDRRPPLTHEDMLRINPEAVARLAAQHDWESAKRLLHENRERLLEALQSIPEEPAGVWGPEHAVGWLVRLLTEHDRHHAAKLKQARSAQGG